MQTAPINSRGQAARESETMMSDKAYEVPALTAEQTDRLGEALDDTGRLRVMPAAFWSSFSTAERAAFGVAHGCYVLPTHELIDYLRGVIAGRRAIEIGAGNGVVAGALDILATDSHQQADPKYAAVYARMGQPVVTYGPNVCRIDARDAVRIHRPQVVVACWVTHRYHAAAHWRGGNEVGVNERTVIDRGAVYVHVGNQFVHRYKPILDLPHAVIHPPWLFSRAMNGSPDEIRIWDALR